MKKQLSKKILIENHKKSIFGLLIIFAICSIGIIFSGIFLRSENHNIVFWIIICFVLTVYLIIRIVRYINILQNLKHDKWIVLKNTYFIKRKELTGQSHPSYNHYLYFDCGTYGVLSYFVSKKLYQNLKPNHSFYLIIVPTIYSKFELIQIYDAHQWDKGTVLCVAAGE